MLWPLVYRSVPLPAAVFSEKSDLPELRNGNAKDQALGVGTIPSAALPATQVFLCLTRLSVRIALPPVVTCATCDCKALNRVCISSPILLVNKTSFSKPRYSEARAFLCLPSILATCGRAAVLLVGEERCCYGSTNLYRTDRAYSV